MKIQLALDMFELEDAIAFARELQDVVQIMEVGTPLVLKEGRRGIEAMKNAFPEHVILADYKLMDAGAFEAEIGFRAGADIVTVCGAANDSTLRGAMEAAERYGKEIMVDMLEVKALKARIQEADSFGAEYIQVHTAFDGRAGKDPVKDLIMMKQYLTHSKAAVAGGIGMDTIRQVAEQSPEIIVIGSSVTLSPRPREQLLAILKCMEEVV